jgi:anti-sigma-K factor RskA
MTDDGTMPVEDDLLVAEYVLGVLPHAERLQLAARMAAEPAIMARVRFWEEQLQPLGAALEPVQPPGAVLDALEQRLFPVERPTAGLWQSLPFWRGLTAALFCAGLAGLGLFFAAPWRTPLPPAASYVAELSGAPDAVRLVALYDAGSGLLKLNRVTGTPASGRDFQLWLIAGDAPPVSLGVLPRQSMTRLSLPAGLADKLGPKAVLAVSDEPQGGSPTGQPTGAVLATGALAAI